MASATLDPVQNVLGRLHNVKPAGVGRWSARCPAHDDGTSSLQVTRGDDGRALVKCFRGCALPNITAALGLEVRDLFLPREAPARQQRRIVRTYDYITADGTLAFQVVRFEPKGFAQRRPDGRGGWTWKLDGLRRVLYRLPAVLAAPPDGWLFIVEGEKDADNLASVGIVATTCPQGAGKWAKVDDTPLTGRRVAILPDNDTPGREHAEQVAQAMHGRAADVRIVTLPDLPAKGDVSDWLDLRDGATPEDLRAMLMEMVEAAPTWAPGATVAAPAATQTEPTTKDSHPLTDLGFAERIVDRHGADLRFCHTHRKWYVWDGRRWAADETGEARRRAKETARSIYAEAAMEVDDARRQALAKFARKCEAAAAISAALALAESELQVAIVAAQFDADPWLLNAANGTIDLRTGTLRQHDRGDLLRKLVPVQYDPDAELPLWDQFLDTATGGDRDLQEFLQRAVGYSLTGDTGEEKLFLLHGPGGTGKSTFIDAIRGTLGDYGQVADFEVFLQRNATGGPRNDIAALEGARLVASIEVDEGKRLAEGVVKTLTGGDSIRARYLYQESFEFRPQFKLWLVCNDAPAVRDSDTGLWRRILLVPLDHTIPEDQRDPRVKRTLSDPAQAGPAVLAWAVMGCLRWQERGLAVPERVTAATTGYREAMDPLKDFLDECCILDSTLTVTRGALRRAYEGHCKVGGMGGIGVREFNMRVRRVAAGETQVGTLKAWRGIGLRHSDDE